MNHAQTASGDGYKTRAPPTCLAGACVGLYWNSGAYKSKLHLLAPFQKGYSKKQYIQLLYGARWLSLPKAWKDVQWNQVAKTERLVQTMAGLSKDLVIRERLAPVIEATNSLATI